MIALDKSDTLCNGQNMMNSPILLVHLTAPSEPIAVGSDWKAYRVEVPPTKRGKAQTVILTVFDSGIVETETLDT